MRQVANDSGKQRRNRHSLYLYTGEGSYEPLARIDRNGNQEQHIYYFHTDLNGMPEELTDEVGETVRECSYQLWNKPIQEIAHQEIQQNLRYLISIQTEKTDCTTILSDIIIWIQAALLSLTRLG
ncbi:RHS domain-containing protein [Snodgrassella sp. M0118]|uniref:RHS domain-containing protein n=1 Tax=Snodgrassella TaxID=1193515 RepID=UPI001E4A1943